ncbi:hypothetical protein GCM10007103_23990 [Salinimicrobium marinum]|uniref:IPT/TIG domain-containing protein n=1 Tax=Salinimicrobium marinum TaxID=680283 RepID=A0A918VYB1_9FLAO|nr:hypothetical protein [Salinimicrobium marinum]GHA41889.1 hypothetical protein GCM10007103_23990 [Salinimicrobium marinum]
MKSLKNRTMSKHPFFLVLLAAFLIASCESDFDVEELEGGNEPPVILSVSEAQEDVPVTQGVLENTYIIRGENLSTIIGIWFNGERSNFNPALGTDQVAFTTIPETAPYVGQENVLRIENTAGVTEYDFSLLNIQGFTESTTEAGVKTVTLLGGDFSDTETVTFTTGTEEDGNLIERDAEILSVSETEATVVVPDGVEQAFIYLTTSRGATAQSESYGFNYTIFIDQLNQDWEMSQWGGTFDVENTDPALGEYSIESVRDAWSGITFTPSTPISFNEYNSITVSLYAAGATRQVNVALNDFNASVEVELTPNQWQKVVIPLSRFYPTGGAPAAINRIDFQEATNTNEGPYTFYIDDFGFL